MRVHRNSVGIVTYVSNNGGKIILEDNGDNHLNYPNTYKSFKELRNEDI